MYTVQYITNIHMHTHSDTHTLTHAQTVTHTCHTLMKIEYVLTGRRMHICRTGSKTETVAACMLHDIGYPLADRCTHWYTQDEFCMDPSACIEE
jgi:predicted HD phosphohydrolase